MSWQSDVATKTFDSNLEGSTGLCSRKTKPCSTLFRLDATWDIVQVCGEKGTSPLTGTLTKGLKKMVKTMTHAKEAMMKTTKKKEDLTSGPSFLGRRVYKEELFKN